METNTLIIIIFILHAIGFLVYKYLKPRIKGIRGEYKVSRVLRKLDKIDYKVINDLYLKSEDRYTQIDHLIISIYGVFVIETKNYTGWIHGNEKSEYWNQTIYKKKTKFRNPVKQNWSHVFFLKEILSDFPRIKYHPIVVFVGEAELKNVFSNVPVLYSDELLETIDEYEAINLSFDEVKDIVAEINQYQVTEKKYKKAHKKQIKKNVRDKKKRVKALLCPNCNGELIKREGTYGAFYGCSSFPKCKYSTKI